MRRPPPPPRELPTPGRITAIEPQKKDPDRVSISINDAFALGVHIDVQLDFGLAVGMELSTGDLERIVAADDLKRATMAALRLIAYRPRSRGELQTGLRERGFSTEAQEAAISRMADLGYLNDEAFAERWVESRLAHKPRSSRMLANELRQKGIDQETIDATLESTKIDEVGDALELARKKAGSLGALDPQARTRRLTGFLARRGYGFDVIRRVIDEIETDED